MLADLVEAPRADGVSARKDETAVIDSCRANYAASFGDAPELGYDSCRVVQRFEHRVAKSRLKCLVVKRQPSAVGHDAGEVSPPD